MTKKLYHDINKKFHDNGINDDVICRKNILENSFLLGYTIPVKCFEGAFW